jgi:cell division transport system permease protein
MQLVGAKSWFIIKPFLSRSIIYGLLAGILASLGLWGLIHYANQAIEELVILQDYNKLMILMGCLLVIGVLIGCMSTFFSIRKYLKMSLDELY